MTAGDGREPEGLSAERPWPGLAAYSEPDQRFFFGRDDETDALLRCVLNERLTLLFGQSGLGKTSLLQAGLFPKLRAENLTPIYIRLDYKSGSPAPGRQVLQRIAETIVSDTIDAPPPAETDTLWGYFHRPDVEWWSQRNYPLIPVLVFDQFEEVFTLGRQNGAKGGAFLDELGDLIENRPPPGWSDAEAPRQPRLQHKILLSFREDFLPDFEALKRRIHSLFLNRIRLGRLTGEAALGIINLSGGHLLAPGLAEEIVRFVAADQRDLPLPDLLVEPALLCVFCRELNERRIAGQADAITPEMLRGGQHAILQQLLDRAFADIPDSVLEYIGEHLLTDTGYRTQCPLEDMERSTRVPAATILKLEQRRILRLESRGDVDWLELTHDLLAPLVLQRRDERRQSAKYRRLVKFSVLIGLPLVLVTLAMIYLADRATESLRLAEVTMLSSLDVGNPNTDSVTKQQDIAVLLGDATGFAASDPVRAAHAYASIARIQLTPTLAAPSTASDAFTMLAALQRQNPDNPAIEDAYDLAIVDRAAAETAERNLQVAESDYQAAVTSLQKILRATPPGQLRQSAMLLLGHAYEGWGDDFQFAAHNDFGAAAATDITNEASGYQKAMVAFQQYVRENPADLVGRAELAWVANKAGDVARDRDDEGDAVAFYNKAVGSLNELGSHLYDSPVWPQHLGLGEMNLGIYKIADGQIAAALVYFTKADTVFSHLRDTSEPDNDDLASDIAWAEDWAGITHYLLAEPGNDAADLKAARDSLTQAQQDRIKIASRNPDSVQWQDDLIHTDAGLHAVAGITALALHDEATARDEFGEAATMTKGILREGVWEYLRLADYDDQKARAELQLGQNAAARQDFAAAQKAMPAADGKPVSLYAATLANRITADIKHLNGTAGG